MSQYGQILVFSQCTPFGMALPLEREVVGDLGVRPREGVVTVANHVERLVPPVVAGDLRADAEQHEEETLVEEHPVGRDRIHLHRPGVDAVGCPAGRVVVAPQLGWE